MSSDLENQRQTHEGVCKNQTPREIHEFRHFLESRKLPLFAKLYSQIAFQSSSPLFGVFDYIELRNGEKFCLSEELASTVHDAILAYKSRNSENGSAIARISCLALTSHQHTKLFDYLLRLSLSEGHEDWRLQSLFLASILEFGLKTRGLVYEMIEASPSGEIPKEAAAWEVFELPGRNVRDPRTAMEHKQWASATSSVPIQMTLHWVAPRNNLFPGTGFLWTAYTYSKQMYRKAPTLQVCNIMYWPSTDTQPRDIVFMFKHEKDFLRFKELQKNECTLSGILDILLTMISADTLALLNNASSFVCGVRLESRDSPRRSRLLELLTIEDHIKISRICIENAFSWVDSWGANYTGIADSDLDRERARKDLAYLTKSLGDLENRISFVKAEMSLLRDFKHSEMAGFLTIIAAIFIPLGFLAGYFGMNTTSFTDGGHVSEREYWSLAAPITFTLVIVPLVAQRTGSLVLYSWNQTAGFSKYKWPTIVWSGVALTTMAFCIRCATRLLQIGRHRSARAHLSYIFAKTSAVEPSVWGFVMGTMFLMLAIEEVLQMNVSIRIVAKRTSIAAAFLLCGGLGFIDRTPHATLLTPWAFLSALATAAKVLTLFERLSSRFRQGLEEAAGTHSIS